MPRKPTNPYAKPDRFSQKAKEEGFAARSVYKLEELDQRFRLLKRGDRVLDLGCAPGSWSQYAIGRIGPDKLVGIDLTEVDFRGGKFVQGSIYDVTAERLLELLGGQADVVLSDMAPLTMGARDADHFAQIELATRAFEVACIASRPGASFVCKVFEGQDAKQFELLVRKKYEVIKRARPEAVRTTSREFFLVAQGFLPEGR